MKDLWDEIQEAKINREGKGKAPMKEIDLDKEQAPMEIASSYGLLGTIFARFSKASSLKELSCFVGYFDSGEDVRRVPTHYKPSLVVLDGAN